MLGYIFWRAASMPFVRHRVSQKLLIGIGLALWASFFLSRVVGPEELGSLATALELWSMTWMAALFLMSAALLAVGAATGFGLFLTWFARQPSGAFLAKRRGSGTGIAPSRRIYSSNTAPSIPGVTR